MLAFLVFRIAFVEAYAARDPGKAGTIWPGHPAVQLESGLAQVGVMAAAARPIDSAVIDRLLQASEKAPLAPEPFLVRGVAAQVAGNPELALRAYLAARQRNPRAVAPRYFLADHYLKSGETELGLAEISALARLVPQSLPKVAPYLAAYARTPSATPMVKEVLRSHPQLESALLNELAADANNAQLVLRLWSGAGGDPWQGRLLNQLVDAGRFNEARAAWARFTGISARPDQLLDPEFVALVPPPFGWRLASGPSGIAEPQGGGRLHALYFGRDSHVLAEQLLTLPPGRYRLSMEVISTSPASRSLAWTVRCLPGAIRLASLPMAKAGAVSVSFAVPSGCGAQRLELVGTPPEFPERAEITVGRMRLQGEGGR